MSVQSESYVDVIREYYLRYGPVPIRLSRTQVVEIAVESLAGRIAESDEQVARKVEVIRAGGGIRPEDAGEHRHALRGEARRSRYKEFWSRMIPDLKERRVGTQRRAPHVSSYYFAAGHDQPSKVLYHCGFTQGNKARVELYLDSDKAFNEALFDYLYERRQAIEAEFGADLVWDRLDANKACRVYVVFPRAVDIGDDDTTLAGLRGWMVERLVSLDRALGPILERYGTSA